MKFLDYHSKGYDMPKSSKKVNGFQKGSGCFTCCDCKKKTRATGRGDNEHVNLCADCYDRGGDENSVSDGHMTEAEFFKIHSVHTDEFKNREAVAAKLKATPLALACIAKSMIDAGRPEMAANALAELIERLDV